MNNKALKVLMVINAATIGLNMLLCGIRAAKKEKPGMMIVNAATAAVAAATLLLNYRTYQMNLEKESAKPD